MTKTNKLTAPYRKKIFLLPPYLVPDSHFNAVCWIEGKIAQLVPRISLEIFVKISVQLLLFHNTYTYIL